MSIESLPELAIQLIFAHLCAFPLEYASKCNEGGRLAPVSCTSGHALSLVSHRFAAQWSKFLLGDVLNLAFAQMRGCFIVSTVDKLVSFISDKRLLREQPGYFLRLALAQKDFLPQTVWRDRDCVMQYLRTPASIITLPVKSILFETNLLDNSCSKFGTFSKNRAWLLDHGVTIECYSGDNSGANAFRAVFEAYENDDSANVEALEASFYDKVPQCKATVGLHLPSDDPNRQSMVFVVGPQSLELFTKVLDIGRNGAPAGTRFGLPIELFAKPLITLPLNDVLTNHWPAYLAASNALYAGDSRLQLQTTQLYFRFVNVLRMLRFGVQRPFRDDSDVSWRRKTNPVLYQSFPFGGQPKSLILAQATPPNNGIACNEYAEGFIPSMPNLCKNFFGPADLLLRFERYSVRTVSGSLSLGPNFSSLSMTALELMWCKRMTIDYRHMISLRTLQLPFTMHTELLLEKMDSCGAYQRFFNLCLGKLKASKARRTTLVLYSNSSARMPPVMIFFDNKTSDVAQKTHAMVQASMPIAGNPYETRTKARQAENQFVGEDWDTTLAMQNPAPDKFIDGRDECKLVIALLTWYSQRMRKLPFDARSFAKPYYEMTAQDHYLVPRVLATMQKANFSQTSTFVTKFEDTAREYYFTSVDGNKLTFVKPDHHNNYYARLIASAREYGPATDTLFSPLWQRFMFLLLQSNRKDCHEAMMRECVSMIGECQDCSELLDEQHVVAEGRCDECVDNRLRYATEALALRGAKRARTEQQ